MFLGVRRRFGIPPELLPWPEPGICGFRSIGARIPVRWDGRRPTLALALCATGSARHRLAGCCRNAEIYRSLVSAMIIVRLRASVAVFDCESCGAMSRGLVDMLDSRTSQASNLRQSVEIKGCPGEGELPVDLWAARDAASCLTRLPPWPHRRPPRRLCGYGWETA